MARISPKTEEEIRRRLEAGEFDSPDELLQEALKALDRERDLERLLIEGLDSGVEELTPEDFDDIRAESRKRLGGNAGS